MKTSLKLLLAASLLSVGFAGTASAVTADVYITGSTAFRNAAVEAIAEMLTQTDGGSTPPLVSYCDDTTPGHDTVANSNAQLFVGYPTATAVTNGMTQHTQYWIHTGWSGSLAGIISLVYAGIIPAPQSGATHPFLPDNLPNAAIIEGSYVSGVNGNITVTNPTGGQRLAVNAETVDHVADGAFSDAYQTSTRYTSPSLTQAGGGVVGVIPFVWVNGYDAAHTGKITNISQVQATQLLSGGLDLAQLSGNDADNATAVFPIGRNADSGTRFVTFSETQFNPVGGAVQYPTQYAVSTSGTSVLVDYYPAETLFSGTPGAQSFLAGQSGYASGGGEATATEISGTNGANSDNQCLTMSYLGESDASNAVKAGCSYVSYNGIAYGTLSGSSTIYNRSEVDEGVYTYWGYEHLYIGTSTSFGSVLNALALQVRVTDAPFGGESITRMAVQRDYEGGPISYVGPGGSTK